MDPIDCARMEAAAENHWLTSLLLRSDWPLSSALGDAGDVGEWWDAISIADSCALAGCRWLPMESRPDSVRDDCEDRVRKADSSAEGARPDGVCAGAGVEPVASCGCVGTDATPLAWSREVRSMIRIPFAVGQA
ncbi:hypothetical protein ACPPTR_17820 [Ralstonia pseudosolanacearum]|uniref:hypothetical protein n=1 Tax=Ralstonia pseudosolanacearum TaxID=1310165 RepID=UPI001E399BA5|nr:hypothetical protein [Ralstonia pseudosolanacearum]